MSRFIPHAAQAEPDGIAPMASAMERATDVLPTPGGPTRHKIWPLDAAGLLLDGKQLQYPLFHFFQAVVLGIEDGFWLFQAGVSW